MLRVKNWKRLAPPWLQSLKLSSKVMKTIYAFLCLLLAASTGRALDKPNVLLICVDDLRPELNCYGADYIQSPHIDQLAARGRIFKQHYVNAPTCGASRYTLLMGKYQVSGGNGAIFGRAKQLKKEPDSVPPSMPAWFRQNGYTTVSVGKVSHHPGGLGGKDWDDPATVEMPDSWDRSLLPAGQWQHPRGWMHGLANGEIRKNAKDMAVIQALEGPDTLYPDGPSTEVALEQLDKLADGDKPFFLAFGILRPHLPFGAPKKYLDLYKDSQLPKTPHPEKPEGKTTWHGSGEFRKYQSWGKNPDKDAEFAIEVRKHYAACVTYADAQVGRIIAKLEEKGKMDNTIIVLWGDHGWHLGEHQVWGKHTLFEESLHSPLIIAYPGINQPGKANASIVETLDIFPTLAGLAKLPKPDYVDGRTLQPLLDDPGKTEHRAAIAYRNSNRTVRTATHRLISHKGDYTELYDHTSPEKETVNISAENEKLVTELKALIAKRLGK